MALSLKFDLVESIIRIPSLSKLQNIFRRSTTTINIPVVNNAPPGVSSSWVPKADREALDVRIEDTWYDLSIWRKNHPSGIIFNRTLNNQFLIHFIVK
jgi:hypothetical protein